MGLRHSSTVAVSLSQQSGKFSAIRTVCLHAARELDEQHTCREKFNRGDNFRTEIHRTGHNIIVNVHSQAEVVVNDRALRKLSPYLSSCVPENSIT